MKVIKQTLLFPCWYLRVSVQFFFPLFALMNTILADGELALVVRQA
jgi:hypothetical protein